ncbi:MAG: dipicolinate synthase subunit B [Clostridia bacterium]|nr:dipicolinate synthase subunit B [Clostridia bacterium]
MSEKYIDLKGKNIGCAMTGSFCTFKEVFAAWEKLKETGANLMPIMSFNACSIDNRFYSAAEAVGIFENICGKKILNTIAQVEPIGPKKLLDLLIVAPCTGNTIAKIASGITDTPVTLAVKSHLRNGRPVVIAVSTNDALAHSAINIGKLLNTRNIYFVPLAQDDPVGKPTSVVAKFDLIPETADLALKNRQIQPVLRGN